MPEAPLTQFEEDLAKEAEPIIRGSKTGYQWRAVDNILEAELSKHLPSPSTRCKKANGSGRAANVLTESNDKKTDLTLVFVVAPYTAEQFVKTAVDRIRRFPNVTTVAVADEINGVRRVRHLVANSRNNILQPAMAIFPGATIDHVTEVDPGEIDFSTGSASRVEPLDHDTFEIDLTGLPDPDLPTYSLTEAFIEHSRNLGITLDLNVAADALACCLAVQQVIFAGPSGTGKSAIAHCLQSFLGGQDRSITIEASRGWTGPEDIVGYYSSITGTFSHTSSTSTLIDLHESTLAGLATGDATPPFLTIEEANLSTIEGYLSPAVHSLGETDSEMLEWHLHAQHEQVPDSEDRIAVPPSLVMGPYPRVLMTINVDPNSPAPARKVSARGAVILMSPTEQPESIKLEKLLSDRAQLPSRKLLGNPTGVGAGETYIGRPSTLRTAYEAAGGSLRTIIDEFLHYTSHVTSVSLSPSSREIEQAVNYVCAFELLLSDGDVANIPESLRTLSLEGALMHFIFPRLDADQFSPLVDEIASSRSFDQSHVLHTGKTVGSMLGPRVRRLAESARAQGVFGMIDFWTALS